MADYPLEFYRRSEQQWRRRTIRPLAPIEDAETPMRRSNQCPQCCIMATEPFVSTYRPGGFIAHYWKCKSCEFNWNTTVRPPLRSGLPKEDSTARVENTPAPFPNVRSSASTRNRAVDHRSAHIPRAGQSLRRHARRAKNAPTDLALRGGCVHTENSFRAYLY